MAIDWATVIATLASGAIGAGGAVLGVWLTARTTRKLNDESRLSDKKQEFASRLLDLQQLISSFSFDDCNRDSIVLMRKLFNHLLILQSENGIISPKAFKDFNESFISFETGIDLLVDDNKFIDNYSRSENDEIDLVNGCYLVFPQLDRKKEEKAEKEKDCYTLRNGFTITFGQIFAELLGEEKY